MAFLPPTFGPLLERSFALAKTWAHQRRAPELPPEDLLEAAALVDPSAPLRILARHGVGEALLLRLADAASARPGQADPDPPVLALSPLLARVLRAAADQGDTLDLDGYLTLLARDQDTLEWLEAHYAPPPEPRPLAGVGVLLDLLQRHHETASCAAAAVLNGRHGANETLLEVERLRAEAHVRWCNTPGSSPVRQLYDAWGLEPFTPAAAAVEAVLVQELRKPGEDPITPRMLTWLACLDGHPRGATCVLDGIEYAQNRGLVQRLPYAPSGQPCLRDPLLATGDLLREVAAASERDPIDDAERARARRWLSAR